MSCRGTEPHRRTFTRTELNRDGVDVVAAAMFEWLAIGILVVVEFVDAADLVQKLRQTADWKLERASEKFNCVGLARVCCKS